MRKPLQFSSITEGIPRIIFPFTRRYDIKPVYFVSPEVLGDSRATDILKEERDRGAEIAAHLHAEHLPGHVNRGKVNSFACSDYPDAVENEMIRELHYNISQSFGVRATSYRAGRFGADVATISILKELGYTIDSSVTPHIDWSRKGGPDFRGFPDQPYFVDVDSNDFKRASGISQILEVPVTIGSKRLPFLPDQWFFWRWLRPSFMLGLELRKLVDDFLSSHSHKNIIVLCIMFHSTELMPAMSPYVRSSFGQKLFAQRLEDMITYLHLHNAEFLTLKEIGAVYIPDLA
jgi:hypothetical protein